VGEDALTAPAGATPEVQFVGGVRPIRRGSSSNGRELSAQARQRHVLFENLEVAAERAPVVRPSEPVEERVTKDPCEDRFLVSRSSIVTCKRDIL
jgi:hypothetical protein